MDLISVIVWIGLAAVPIAVLSGWLAGAGNRPLTALVLGREGWRRSETAWPHGVQEDDDVTWQFAEPGRRLDEARPADPPGPTVSLERARPRLHLRSR